MKTNNLLIQDYIELQNKRNSEARERSRIKLIDQDYKQWMALQGVIFIDNKECVK